jgi:DNA-binding CsgD family transcriptional regulator
MEAVAQRDLVGRSDELARLASLVDATRSGLSGALLLRGDPGVGKTALLSAVRRDAPDLQRFHLVGVEAESHFAFAALQRFAGAHLPGVDDLPSPQRAAVEVAFGQSAGPPADPFLVGLATLGLLASAAGQRPTLVTVDDAHWLDRESMVALGFAARRLDAESVAMVFAARGEGTNLAALDGLDTIDLGALDRDSALSLLSRVVSGSLDTRVAERVYDVTAGNALALVDLGAGLSAEQLDGSERLPEPLAVGSRLERHYAQTVLGLDGPARSWLLLAAADTSGNRATLADAANRLGLPTHASAAAESAGLVAIRDTVEFRHPLIRSATYATATSTERQAVHSVLASAISKSDDPDRHVAHLVAAADGPDESVAVELVAAAARARDRGGLAACADLLEQASALTPDRPLAANRLLEAAEAALGAGEPRRCAAALDRIENDDLEQLGRARARLVRAQCVGLSGEELASAKMAAECLGAAIDAGPLDPAFTQAALADACQGVMIADRLIRGTSAEEISRVARSAPKRPDDLSASLVTAFATISLDGYEAAIPAIRTAVAMLLDPATPDDVVLQRHLLGITLCTISLDHSSAYGIEERVERIARDSGALGVLDHLLFARSMSATLFGHLDQADAFLEEGVQLHTVLARSSREFNIYRHPELAALRCDDRAKVDEVVRTADEAAVAMGHGAVAAVCDVARMTLGLADGDYRSAKEAGRRLLDGDVFAMHTRILPDLVEAAHHDGDELVATETLDLLRERAAAADTTFALAALARAEALLSPPETADEKFERSIQLFGETESVLDLARSHLVYGEWLRRERRVLDARMQLGHAHELFVDMGANGFSERAGRELKASGGRSSTRSPTTTSELTGQERQIANLAAEGLTNAEIAARLYISAPTVDYHLRKVFRKLDIGSRRQLRGRRF